ncbi:hypothetical protein [uncultured Fibrobacter sp.]|uniref:hypothetical protein n=1 Tax=uncultured Fibrobacter sp. TaxID=261512 RepID=UPI001B1ECF88|nr:hypothetical protein [uncultured Fibrobacter sp.]MBO7105033.1 hypothetical protein [Fibrobacter sp.]MBR3669009.1 hypothetical protein [Fibrobacter sp.]
MMVLKKTHISRILSVFATLVAGLMTVACFDIPSEPSERNTVKGVSVYVKQGENIDSTLLKIHPQEVAEIFAKTTPDKFSDDLTYEWYKEDKENGDVRLGDGNTYHISQKTDESQIPDKLVVRDAENNVLVSHFDIIINTPPEIDSVLKPQPSDTLYGNTKTAFQFEWRSHDKDNEDFTYTILIDDNAYVVGEFNKIRQSGFSEGEHSFQVIMTDNYGDSDSSEVILFYVKPQQGDSK